MRLEATIISKKGSREINEDDCNFAEIQGKYCFVVADGLGGHEGGEVASKVAVSAVMEAFRREVGSNTEHLKIYLEEAQSALLQYEKKQLKYAGMRTTIVVLISDGFIVNWAYVGDSRLYYLKKGKVEIRSKDHSVPQVLVNAGEILEEEIRFHEDRNKLLRVLGNEEDFRPTFGMEISNLAEGDAFLLCTDGFWEYILEKEMEESYRISNCPYDWILLLEETLQKNIQKDKSNDNYTAIAIFVK